MFGTSLNPHRDIKTAHCHGVIWFKDSILLQMFYNFSLEVVVNLYMFPFVLSVSLMFLRLTWKKMFWSTVRLKRCGPCFVTAGFSHLLPWYYMIYFIILLVHRDSRDMSECRRKYGSAWDEYCRTVRYRIIPRVY